MNECFFIGKIISNIDFKFIVNSKKYFSITTFKIKLENQSIITVKGYNEIADFCYKNLIKNNYIALYGEIDGKMEIALKNAELIWKDIKIWDKKDRKVFTFPIFTTSDLINLFSTLII